MSKKKKPTEQAYTLTHTLKVKCWCRCKPLQTYVKHWTETAKFSWNEYQKVLVQQTLVVSCNLFFGLCWWARLWECVTTTRTKISQYNSFHQTIVKHISCLPFYRRIYIQFMRPTVCLFKMRSRNSIRKIFVHLFCSLFLSRSLLSTLYITSKKIHPIRWIFSPRKVIEVEQVRMEGD